MAGSCARPYEPPCHPRTPVISVLVAAPAPCLQFQIAHRILKPDLGPSRHNQDLQPGPSCFRLPNMLDLLEGASDTEVRLAQRDTWPRPVTSVYLHLVTPSYSRHFCMCHLWQWRPSGVPPNSARETSLRAYCPTEWHAGPRPQTAQSGVPGAVSDKKQISWMREISRRKYADDRR